MNSCGVSWTDPVLCPSPALDMFLKGGLFLLQLKGGTGGHNQLVWQPGLLGLCTSNQHYQSLVDILSACLGTFHLRKLCTPPLYRSGEGTSHPGGTFIPSVRRTEGMIEYVQVSSRCFGKGVSLGNCLTNANIPLLNIFRVTGIFVPPWLCIWSFRVRPWWLASYPTFCFPLGQCCLPHLWYIIDRSWGAFSLQRVHMYFSRLRIA